MTELYPSDAQLNALSGTSDTEQEVLFIPTGESPYYTSFYKMLYRLLDTARRAGDVRVFKDGAMTFGVRAGRFSDGPAIREFIGAADQSLADDATTYIYLLADGTLATNTSGLPSPADTPYLPLAMIAVSGGSYSHQDITDLRGLAMYRCSTGMAMDDQNVLTGGGNADALHTHSTMGLENLAVTAAKLSDALADSVPNLSITAGAESADARTITVQAKDVAGNNLAARMKLRLWIAAADFGAPDATGNAVAASGGTILRTLATNADYDWITDATGKAQVTITVSGAATRYVLAEIDGRIYSSGAVAWNA